jgi:hypothetical protein
MIALYEIADDYARALDIDIDSEVDAEALTVLLGEITDRFENKAAAVVAYQRNLLAEAKAFSDEAGRLAKKAVMLDRRAESLASYLELEMRRCNLTECKAGLASLKFVKNPWAVEIDAGATLPAEYMRQPPTPPPAPDKKLIGDDLKAGKVIEGARLVQKERLKIS